MNSQIILEETRFQDLDNSPTKYPVYNFSSFDSSLKILIYCLENNRDHEIHVRSLEGDWRYFKSNFPASFKNYQEIAIGYSTKSNI